MCRASNTLGIRPTHMEWREDAMCIYFAHQKNDQGGQQFRDPRHIYANLLSPSICPILVLAISWATSGFGKSDLLFEGNIQYEKFQKLLKQLLAVDDVMKELNRTRKAPETLRTHSFKKRGSGYCSSGSTACPPSTAVSLRAGWTLGGVQNTYLRYESAGDMYVGRTVAGLPLETP